MKQLLVALTLLVSATAFAQKQNPHDIAYNYMRTGDQDNAIIVLNKALEKEPDNQQLQQDLAMAYFLKKDYVKAKEVAEKLIDRDDAEVVSYQIAGNVYKATADAKDGEKMYKKALKKYPNSGPLYNEYGELMALKGSSATAIKLWEKGIELDPSYPANYFNAASYYYNTNDKVWTIIYGEIFANMEYLTERGSEMRKLLLAAYKEKLFSENDNSGKEKSEFANAVLATFGKQKGLIGRGLTVESLTMIRTKFVLDWFAAYGKKFPFKLFDYQQQLIKEGMFGAYNQWLFASAENLPAFDQWSKSNSTAFTKFDSFQKSRVFKMPQGQYYQKF
jgi:tetratricopeptide (TPR) repeat protein